MSTPQEQRRAQRVARSIMARYRVGTRATWLMSPLHDLSSGGARFLSEYPFTVAEQFDLQLLLPTAPQPVVVRARVAWTKPGPLQMVEVGVTFDPGDAKIQELIDVTVAHFLKKPS